MVIQGGIVGKSGFLAKVNFSQLQFCQLLTDSYENWDYIQWIKFSCHRMSILDFGGVTL